MIDSRRPIEGKGRAAVVVNVGAKVRPLLVANSSLHFQTAALLFILLHCVLIDGAAVTIRRRWWLSYTI